MNNNLIEFPTTIEKLKEFEVGKTYETASICDSECIFKIKVIKRSKKSITIKWQNEEVRRKVYIEEGIEKMRIERYSMAPVFSANKEEE